MPELPEVETVRAIMHREVTGRRIIGVSLRKFPGVIGATPPDEFTTLVTHRSILAPERRGKYLLLPLDNGHALVIHLRMTGRLLVTRSESPPVRFEHLALHLDDGNDIRFADQRKFGRVLPMSLDDARRALSTALGPEPLSREFTGAYLVERMRNRSAPIKTFLLDQRHVAGLGNIYVDEALFRSKIHPLTPAGEITQSQVASLVRSIRRVLRSAIENQGTTFFSFENPYGERGSNEQFLSVYGRAREGLPCVRCGKPLAWFKLAGRGTSYCPNCQQVLP